MDFGQPPRPTTPNTVMYDGADDSTDIHTALAKKRPMSRTSPPPPPMYYTPDGAKSVNDVGGGKIWTVEDEDDDDEKMTGIDELDDEETRILLEKEFDDFYEDQVHKSAGPVVFVSKMLGMLPAIWTEEESESECKSYFNLYTFVIFAGWVGLAVITGLRIGKIEVFPGDILDSFDGMSTTNSPEVDKALQAVTVTATNATEPMRFMTRSSFDTYFACTWTASLVALLFGIFKCRSMADVLFGLSETDAQLELYEKHYNKIKRKSMYWIFFLAILLLGHGAAFLFMLRDLYGFGGGEVILSSVGELGFDVLLWLADFMAHGTIFCLDLQFLFLAMVLCKRYRLVNKLLVHVGKPWKTFRDEKPPNYVLQNILQHRFDQLFEPGSDDFRRESMSVSKMDMLTKKAVPMDLLFKGPEEQKVSKEEENTFILQLDILRGIHADLSALAQEVNHLLGFQIVVHLVTSIINVIMFAYFFIASTIDGHFYWPYLVLCLLPAIKIFLIGHWGQVLEQQSKQPFMTICQVSTVDGSPRLERQVQKLTIQMHHQCPTLTAAGYFTLGRNMILKTVGMAVAFSFFMVKFEEIRQGLKMTTRTKST